MSCQSVALPRNAYGNVDISAGCPAELHHLPGKHRRMLDALQIEHAPAFKGFDRVRGSYFPRISGLVVRSSDRERIEAAIEAKAPKPKPKRGAPTTERQIARLKKLSHSDLIDKATLALHALNRRAKQPRTSEEQRADIYALKDRYLDALVRAGLANVYSFVIQRPTNWYCVDCEHRWGGRDPECHGCGTHGYPEGSRNETWYVVEHGQYRFHQPQMAFDLVARAVPTEPHEPTQPVREIPDVNLTIAAQIACVEMATLRLARGDDALVLAALEAHERVHPPRDGLDAESLARDVTKGLVSYGNWYAIRDEDGLWHIRGRRRGARPSSAIAVTVALQQATIERGGYGWVEPPPNLVELSRRGA